MMMAEYTLRRSKSRELSSPQALLSPSPSSSPPSAASRAISSFHRRSSVSYAALKRRSADSSSAPSLAVLWPSASSAATNKPLSLADHLGNDRLSDPHAEPKKNGARRSLHHPAASSVASPQPLTLGRQRSCSEYSTRFKQEEAAAEDKKKKNKRHSSKENSPVIGGSMRYTGNVISFPASPNPAFVLSSRSLVARGKSDIGLDSPSSESDRSERVSGNQYWRKPTRSSSSSVAYRSAATQWALSPGRRSRSPPVVDWAASPDKAKSAGKGKSGSFISLGLDLFRRKWKENHAASSSTNTYGLKKGRAGDEAGHQLRLLQNRLIQWQWVNARSERVELIKTAQAEVGLSGAWLGLSSLQASVFRKRVQLEKNKLHLKLIALLSSQLKVLEEWREMERQHTTALSATNDCLRAAVCRIPLADGAKVNLQLLSPVILHATELASTTLSRITHPDSQKPVALLLELKQVVSSERALLEECFNLMGCMTSLHIQEQSLKCHLIQLHSAKSQWL